MAARDPLRSGDFETVADAGAAVKSPSDPSSSAPPSSAPSDAMMTVELGPDSPTLAGAPVRKPPPGSGDDDSVFPPGTVLGQRYEILQILGQGGMGAVYKALDREVNRAIALKVIRPDLARNSSIIERFKQELVLSQQVTHRNVVRIYDLGEADGVKFITMEYIEGSDLRSLIKERKAFPPGEAVEIMIQICRALEAAHGVGVIHRDLKPQNIMRDHQGRIIVMDFGLARLMESNGMTQTGALVGTMEYMSPEQALGGTLDQRSDLFTLGLIFYELLSGKMPFHAESALASLIKRTQERAVLVSQHDKTIPDVLANIVNKCMERDPKLRYQSATELLNDLEAWQGKRAAATLNFPASQQPWGQTIPWHWVGGAAALLVLLSVGFLLRSKISSSAAPAAQGPVVSLAVLPFHNASGDPSADWLGSSIAEMLTTDVGQSAQLHVASADSMHELLRDMKITAETSLDDASIRRAAEFSNSDQVVWGQYVKLGDQIRLDATIRDLKQQRSIQLKTQTANQQDVFAAVDRLAQEIRKHVAVSDSVEHELSTQAFRPSTKSLTAMRDYNEGLGLARDGKNLDAVGKFEAATREDPQFALGFAELAETDAALGYGDKADAASRQAVDLAQQLPAQERYRVLAIQAMVSNDNKKAIEYYQTLAKAAPEDSSIQLALAKLEKDTGKYDTARDALQKVITREPNNAEALVSIAEVENERRNPQGALDYLNRGLTLAVQLDNYELRSRVLFDIGHTYRLLNKPDEALRNYQESLSIRRRLDQKAGIARTLAEIAEVEYSQGNLNQAIAGYTEAVQLQRQIGDKVYLSHTLMNFGGIYMDRGKYDEALKYLKESLQMQRELNDENYEAMCLGNIGSVYFLTAKYDDALTYFQQTLQLLQKLKETGEMPTAFYDLGDASSRLGQFDQASSYYLQGLQLARSNGNKQLGAYGADRMAIIFKYQGRYEAAAKSEEESVNGYREIQERSPSSAQALGNYGETLALLGRGDESQKTLDEALSLARDIKDDSSISQTLNDQGERAFYAGDLKSAKSLFEQALQTATRNKDRENILAVKINLAWLAGQEGTNKPAEWRSLQKEADDLGLKYQSAQCSVFLAESLLKTKDYRAAEQEADRALQASEKFGFKFLIAKAQYTIGKALSASHQPEASSHYQEARRVLQDMNQEFHSGAFLKRSDVAAMLIAIQ